MGATGGEDGNGGEAEGSILVDFKLIVMLNRYLENNSLALDQTGAVEPSTYQQDILSYPPASCNLDSTHIQPCWQKTKQTKY